MLSCPVTIIFSIPPSQAENDKDFSLELIYISAYHERLSVDIISSLVTPPEKYIDIFKGSTDHIQDQINDMESSVDLYNKLKYEDLKKINNT